jgi:hypothetical protein
MKDFLKKNWSLILVIIYIILPDFVVGPFDDAALLLVERVINTYVNRKKESKEQTQPNTEKPTSKTG